MEETKKVISFLVTLPNGKHKTEKIVACPTCGALILEEMSRLHVCVKPPEEVERADSVNVEKNSRYARARMIELSLFVSLGLVKRICL